LFYFQIASLFTYMTTRMNEWTTTHTTAAASSIDVRVSDLDLFYFWFIQFVCDYSSLFYSHHVLFWLFFFAKAYLLMYFLIFFYRSRFELRDSTWCQTHGKWNPNSKRTLGYVWIDGR
jgi:hypothetical protein